MSRLYTPSSHSPLASGARRRRGIEDHPVFQALPITTRQRILDTGRLHQRESFGPPLEEHELHFILQGAAGLFPALDDVCVSVVPAGAVHGWERALFPTSPGPWAVPLVETLLFSVPPASILDTLGRGWLTRLLALQAQQRLRALEAEVCCNASHGVLGRLAKWILRLHDECAGAPLHITQAQLGRMLGVQRTSINVAAARLQALDLVRFGRARLRILDLAGLRAASCGCSASAPSASSSAAPAPEGRSFLPPGEGPVLKII